MDLVSFRQFPSDNTYYVREIEHLHIFQAANRPAGSQEFEILRPAHAIFFILKKRSGPFAGEHSLRKCENIA
jgi:hypothetical protein